MVDTMEVLTSLFALAAGVATIALVVARGLASRSPRIAGWGRRAADAHMELTAVVAVVSTAGSLYFSEYADYVPCRLCWFQRIAMYPIAVVAVIALFRRDHGARWYAVPMAAIGAGISTYHYLIERGVLADSESCGLFGPACADVWFEEFGFVTLAFMALAGFVAILAVNLITFPPITDDDRLETT